jgi:hypothetical protein
MRTFFIFLTAFTLFTCSSENSEQNQSSTDSQSAAITEPAQKSRQATPQVKAPDPIIGERIDGPANIRDQINGKLLFSLNDHTLVNCTPLQNDWYQIGLLMDIEAGQSGMLEISEGQKIRVDGREVGEVKSDMSVYSGTDGEKSWAELIGYTHKDNIKPESIIETALSEYMSTVDNERSVAQLQDFIQQFQLEKNDGFEGYTIYYNYENWIEDPSPMWRIGLVFQNNRLVSILHSRPLEIAGTNDHRFNRGFDCLTYKDVDNSSEIVKMFRQFVNSVD